MKCCAILILFCFTVSALAQKKSYILALSKAEKKMAVYDFETLDSITSVDVSEDPHEIMVRAEARTAFISHPVMNGSGHLITQVNLENLKTEKVIDTRPFYIPHGLAYHSDRLWYTAQGSKSVVVYDTKSGKTQEVFGTGQDFTHLIYLKKDGSGFFTTNVESGTVSIYEKTKLPPYMPPTGVLPANAKDRLEWRQTLVDAGIGAEGFDVTKDETELWTARPDGFAVAIDLSGRKVSALIDTKVLGLHRLKITPDGKTVCIVSVKTGDLLFLDRNTHKIEQKLHIGRGAGIFIDNKNRMFISCTPDNFISVIDLVTRKEIRKIKIGRPDGVNAIVRE